MDILYCTTPWSERVELTISLFSQVAAGLTAVDCDAKCGGLVMSESVSTGFPTSRNCTSHIAWVVHDTGYLHTNKYFFLNETKYWVAPIMTLISVHIAVTCCCSYAWNQIQLHQTRWQSLYELHQHSHHSPAVCNALIFRNQLTEARPSKFGSILIKRTNVLSRAARFGFNFFQSLRNMTSSSAAVMPTCLSNFRAIQSL